VPDTLGRQGQPQGTKRQYCASQRQNENGDDTTADDAAARLGWREIGFHAKPPASLIEDNRRDNAT
ncbi:hypothetical protein, partial [Reyranella sp.]|uniref:hypothetical protein n=1 Tax=Reyranella sp. TaxID=1929291 RepID=UPI003D0C5EBA